MSTASGSVVAGSADWVNSTYGEGDPDRGRLSSDAAWVDFEPESGSVDLMYSMTDNHNSVAPMKFEELSFPWEITWDFILDVSSWLPVAADHYQEFVVSAVTEGEEHWLDPWVGYDSSSIGVVAEPTKVWLFVTTGHIPTDAPGYGYRADTEIPITGLNKWWSIRFRLDDYGTYGRMWPTGTEEPEDWQVWETSDWTLAECNAHMLRWVGGVQVPVPPELVYPAVPFNTFGWTEIDTNYYYSPSNSLNARGFFRFANFDGGSGVTVSGSGR